ncbi:helix-turn-helix transcriptional regulator [Spirosoma litoris]
MTINDKIKQILLDKNLTPSYFADEIGVQRSSISHILSGRNRPSFDIIQKIIRRFPELGYEWIMEEDGQVTPRATTNSSGYNFNRGTGVGRPTIDRAEPVTIQPSMPSYPPKPSGIRSQRTEIPPLNTPNPMLVNESNLPEPTPNVGISSEKKVERILIFYTDGSFREYMPTT